MSSNPKHSLSGAIFAGTALMALAVSTPCVSQPRYDYSKLQLEVLNRGVIAVRSSASEVALSWRYLRSDASSVRFDVYRNDQRIAHNLKQTFWLDAFDASTPATYRVVCHGKSADTSRQGTYTLAAHAPIGYLPIALDVPPSGTSPDGREFRYFPNDASIGDVDGDGSYEIILKWEPTNGHDNSHRGYTGPTLLDCYTLAGQKLWRIDLGPNIRSGAHYTQFMVYDFDGDGRAEVVMKTADGTTDGTGTVIGDAKADHRTEQGLILTGNEYLTVFEGLTGRALCSVPYVPERGDVKGWGDGYGNRSERYLAGMAFLDGQHPSVVMCRGYYTRSVLAAWDWDGHDLRSRWVFDTNAPEWHDYAGQGNHNLRVGDVDGDGCDEIVYGSMTVDHNGRGLYNTGLGHGDAMHLTAFNPKSPLLQVWSCHESHGNGATLRDAKTGKILLQTRASEDVGRCMAADIDPTNPGVEMWSLADRNLYNFKGEAYKTQPRGLSFNMAVWWDGDLLRELLDKNRISKYDWNTHECRVICTMEGAQSNNWTKANPCLQADIIGDWREEVLMRNVAGDSLRLYVSPIPTDYRFYPFVQDPVYRISVATQNVSYNQPTQPGFYFGPDMKK